LGPEKAAATAFADGSTVRPLIRPRNTYSIHAANDITLTCAIRDEDVHQIQLYFKELGSSRQ
jgi:hypothetical protein